MIIIYVFIILELLNLNVVILIAIPQEQSKFLKENELLNIINNNSNNNNLNENTKSKFLFFQQQNNTGIDDFSMVPICVPNNCPKDQGVCINNKCQCLTGFITITTKTDHRFCNYEQKSMKIAFLFEACGFIGFGHIYAGRFFYGIIKCLSIYSVIMFGIQFIITFLAETSDTKAALYTKYIISFACLSFPLVWHLVDLINFCNNVYSDGNGNPMLYW